MMNRILPIILILLAIGLFWVYVLPTYNGKVQAEQQQIQTYNGALQAAQQFNQKESQLLAQKNAIPQSSVSRLESFLPDGVDNVQLILDLNQLASRSGLSLSQFTITDNSADGQNAPGTPIQDAAGASAASGLTNSLTLSVNASGTYNSFRTFLSAAEQSLRPLDVTALTVQQSPTGTYTYDITFRIYWLQ